MDKYMGPFRLNQHGPLNAADMFGEVRPGPVLEAFGWLSTLSCLRHLAACGSILLMVVVVACGLYFAHFCSCGL